MSLEKWQLGQQFLSRLKEQLKVPLLSLVLVMGSVVCYCWCQRFCLLAVECLLLLCRACNACWGKDLMLDRRSPSHGSAGDVSLWTVRRGWFEPCQLVWW
eukprot:GHRQ01037257.1.p2 GENE.GHRQ01037257.1~~GHRQ01037257.1.p2  ORF type:complete len:100 (-),score=18.91 GHRQ01037257.1:58-357(-)